MTDVVITGLGLVTPAGIGVEEAWRGVLAGQPAAADHPDLVEAGLDVTLACSVDADPADDAKARRRLDRFTRLGIAAAREAVAAAGLPTDDASVTDRLGVALGCGIGGVATWEEQHAAFLAGRNVSPFLLPRMLSNMAAGQLAIELDARGPNITVNTACASGASAIRLARDMLRSGSADVVLAGGVEASITPLSVAGFDRMGALSHRGDAGASRPFDSDRDGFVMGEGAGILVLERADDAQARGARALAVVAGAGAAADAHHQTAPPADGSGAVLAMKRALADAGAGPGDVGHVNAHGTSTPLNDRAESAALRAVFGDALDGVPVTSTKGVTGHMLGAAGAVEAVFSVLAMRDGCVPPTANHERPGEGIELDIVHGAARPFAHRSVLSNAFGFGGQNETLLLVAA